MDGNDSVCPIILLNALRVQCKGSDVKALDKNISVNRNGINYYSFNKIALNINHVLDSGDMVKEQNKQRLIVGKRRNLSF